LPVRALALVLLAGALVLAAAGCGGGDDSSSEAPTDTTTATAPSGNGDAAAGKEVFASAGCGGCHTFSAAGSSGSVGPNLDEAAPSFDHVVTQVTEGGGAMPPFKDKLTEQQIQDVAAFVSGS
jgi:mono/diheme cytochrome c family protein